MRREDRHDVPPIDRWTGHVRGLQKRVVGKKERRRRSGGRVGQLELRVRRIAPDAFDVIAPIDNTHPNFRLDCAGGGVEKGVVLDRDAARGSPHNIVRHAFADGIALRPRLQVARFAVNVVPGKHQICRSDAG